MRGCLFTLFLFFCLLMFTNLYDYTQPLRVGEKILRLGTQVQGRYRVTLLRGFGSWQFMHNQNHTRMMCLSQTTFPSADSRYFKVYLSFHLNLTGVVVMFITPNSKHAASHDQATTDRCQNCPRATTDDRQNESSNVHHFCFYQGLRCCGKEKMLTRACLN